MGIKYSYDTKIYNHEILRLDKKKVEYWSDDGLSTKFYKFDNNNIFERLSKLKNGHLHNNVNIRVRNRTICYISNIKFQ